ncbi:MAG: AsmA-like C-terminal region-containing protein [bacterium]
MRVARHITKLFFRILVSVLLLLVLGLGTGMLIVKAMFTPEHLSAVLTDQLQQIFQRPVKLGQVSVVFFRGIKIEDLKVMDAPDLPGRSFISSGVLIANYRLLPLLTGKLVFKELNLESPKIEILRRHDGSWNFSDIADKHRLRRKRHPAGMALDLGADRMIIHGGTVNYMNLRSNFQHTVHGIDFSFSDFRPDGDFPFSLSLLTKNSFRGRIREGSLYFEGMLNLAGLTWQKAALKNASIDASFGDRPFSVKGRLNNFINPEISMNLELPDLSARDLEYFSFSMPGVSLPSSRWTVEAAFPAGGKIELRSVEGKLGPLALRARGDFDFTEDSPRHRLWVQGGPFQLNALRSWWNKAAAWAPSGKAQFKLAVDSIDKGIGVSKVFVLLDKAAFRMGGFRFSDINIVFSARDDFREFSFKTTGGSVSRGGQKISDIRADCLLSGENLEVRSLSAKWNGFPLKGRLSASSLFSKRRKLDIMAYLGKLDIPAAGEMLKSVAGTFSSGRKKTAVSKTHTRLKWLRDFRSTLPDEFPVFSGLVQVDRVVHSRFSGRNLRAAWSLKGISAGMKKLSGRISVEAGPGVFYQVQTISEQNKFYRVAFMPFMAMFRLDRLGALKVGARFKDMDFRKIAGDYDLKAGRMKIRNFYVDGSTISACSEGSINWVDENMDVKVYTIFSAESAMGGVSESLTDASGKPALAFTIKGEMEKPSINMLSPKKNGKIIGDASAKGLRADFSRLKKFVRGE